MTVADLERAAETRWLAAWLAGPTRTRWTSLPIQVGDAAPDLELFDSTGARRRLSETWVDRPALLVFLRHFGCSCLRERWETLAEEIAAFQEAGANVAMVTQAEPERAAAVSERRGYPLPVWCDPERRAYEAYGLLEGTPAQVVHDFPWKPGDPAGAHAMGLDVRRGTERGFVDSPWQLPGEFVVGRDGRIVHAHRAQFCEDFPARGVLLGAIAAAQPEGSR